MDEDCDCPDVDIPAGALYGEFEIVNKKGLHARATAKFEALARQRGTAPFVRLTAAFSDGQRLYALRYASDDLAPTLYHRWSDGRGGRAVVSEPLDQDESDWLEVPPQSFCVFEGREVSIRPFLPDAARAAA